MSFEELQTPDPEYAEAHLSTSGLAEVISLDEMFADRRFLRGLQDKRIAPTGADSVDPVRSYLNSIGQFPLLQAEEEVRLAQIIERAEAARTRLQARQHDTEVVDHSARQISKQVELGDTAKDIFITSNLRLVVSIAKKRNHLSGMELLDVIQEGNIGLNRAVEKFDWRKGYKFSTYATFWIKQAIGRGIDNQDLHIRLPGNVAVELRAARKGVSDNDTPLDERMQTLNELSMVDSLDNAVGDSATEVIDLLPDTRYMPETLVMSDDVREYAERLLSMLPPKQQDYLREYFGFNDKYGTKQTYETIARERNLSREMVRRYVKSATLMLKDLVEDLPGEDDLA